MSAISRAESGVRPGGGRDVGEGRLVDVEEHDMVDSWCSYHCSEDEGNANPRASQAVPQRLQVVGMQKWPQRLIIDTATNLFV
jgi:hypothetical protein